MSAATWQVRFLSVEEFVFFFAEFIQVEAVRGGDLHIGDKQALLVELPLV